MRLSLHSELLRVRVLFSWKSFNLENMCGLQVNIIEGMNIALKADDTEL